jgi:hypothetical protein
VARAVRVEYGGAFYHVMARGNRRERIFHDEADRLRRAQGSFGKFAFRTNGCEAELDRREVSDAQRSKRESTSSPIPCKETEIDGRLQRISPVCQDLMTDPYSILRPTALYGVRNRLQIAV